MACDEKWMEYVDTLQDSLSKSKEFVASISSTKDTLINELKEKHK